MSLSVRSTVKQKLDKINSLLTCLCYVDFCGMTAGLLSCHWIFIALHSVLLEYDIISLVAQTWHACSLCLGDINMQSPFYRITWSHFVWLYSVFLFVPFSVLCQSIKTTLCKLGNFSLFFLSSDFFSKLTFSKNSFRNTITGSYSLDLDQAQHSVGPDLCPNCLQRDQQQMKKFAAGRLRVINKQCLWSWPQTFFILNSAEHEISTAQSK